MGPKSGQIVGKFFSADIKKITKGNRPCLTMMTSNSNQFPGFPSTCPKGKSCCGKGGPGVVLLLAWASARATVYSITSARVVMRIGAALSITLNLPFSQIASADLAKGPGDSGTIALRPLDNTKLSYIICWPHVRPWHMRHPEPALRCISNATDVAALLSKAAQMNLITARNQSARSSHAAQANTVAAE